MAVQVVYFWAASANDNVVSRHTSLYKFTFINLILYDKQQLLSDSASVNVLAMASGNCLDLSLLNKVVDSGTGKTSVNLH